MEKREEEIRWQKRVLFWVQLNPMLIIASLTALCIAILDPTPPPTPSIRLDRVATVRGTIFGIPEPLPDSTLFFEITPASVLQQSRSLDLDGRIAVYVPLGDASETHPLRPGDSVQFTTYLREPSHYLVPGVADFRKVARRLGVPYRAYLKSAKQLERLPSSGRRSPVILVQRAFASFEEHCRDLFSPASSGLILGVFSGRKKALLSEKRDDVEKLGIFHLLVVSGFHISVLVLFLHYSLRRWKRFSRLATIALLWTYIAGIGMPLAAVRAGIMNSLVYLSLTLGVGGCFLNSVGLSAVCLMIWTPSIVFTPGFQFSYVCLLAIGVAVLPTSIPLHQAISGIADAYSSEHHLRYLTATETRRRWRYLVECLCPRRPGCWQSRLIHFFCRGFTYLGDLALCSLSISVAIAPLTAYYSNVLVWSQSLTNLIMVPLFSSLIVLSFLYFVTFKTLLEALLRPFLTLIATLAAHLIDVLQQFAFFVFLPQPVLLEIVIYAAVVWLGWILLSGMRKTLLLLFPTLLSLFALIPQQVPGILEITMLDVGQGESVHVRYPDGSHGLVDTGGLALPDDSHFMARRVVGRYLWSERARRLHYLLITHPHMDHQKGYPLLQQLFRPEVLYYSTDHPDYRPPLWKVGQGYSFAVGGVAHDILHPDLTHLKSFSTNNASIVMQLDYHDFQILLTGDIESAVEQILQGRTATVDVLKVAHHGSRSSTTPAFLSQTSPKIALISSGRRNRFGHPSKAVLVNLRNAGASVYNTANLGSIRLSTNGRQLKIFHYDENLDGFCLVNTLELRSDKQTITTAIQGG